jgi:outer membrane protein assembly factor BamB
MKKNYKYLVYICIFVLVLLLAILVKTSQERYYPSSKTIPSYNNSLTQQGMNQGKNYVYGNGYLNKVFSFNAKSPVISTPTIVNGIAYIGTSSMVKNIPDYIYAINASNGNLIWKYKTNNQMMNQPLVANGVVYTGSGNNMYKMVNGSMVRGSGTNDIYAINAKTGKLIWMKTTNGENMPSFAYKRGILYVANGGKHFYAIDAKNGKTYWRDTLKGVVSMSSIDLSGNIAYFGEGLPNQNQYVAAINTVTKKIMWQRKMPDSYGGITDCSPASNSKYLVISGLGLSPTPNKFYEILYVMNKRTGNVVWDHILGLGSNPFAMETSNPIIVHNTVYVGNPVGKGRFYSFNINSGKINWDIKIYGVQKGSAVYSNGILYFGDGFDNFYAVQASSGNVLGVHRFDVGKSAQFTAANPALVNNEIYIGSMNGYVYAFPDTYLYNYNLEFIKYGIWSLFYKVFGVRY